MKKYFEVIELLKNYGITKIFCAGLSEIYRKFWMELVNNSYSQKGEDTVIDKLFDKNFIGRYLEIGAYHPSRLSNTYRFYKKGWRGTVVEPNPRVKKIFEKIRPEDRFLNIGVSSINGNMNYYMFLIPALNTFSKFEAEKSQKKGHKLLKIQKVATKTLDNIISEKVDYLSIDTEGFDEKILRKWDWNKHRPVVICVETDKESDVNKLLKEKGYKKHFENNFNSIFVLKKSKPGDGRKQ